MRKRKKKKQKGKGLLLFACFFWKGLQEYCIHYFCATHELMQYEYIYEQIFEELFFFLLNL